MAAAGSAALVAAWRTSPAAAVAGMPWQVCPDVEVAPAGAPDLVWRACGDGCRELALDGEQRVFGAIGGRGDDGARWLALIHDHGAAHELAVYRLPAPAPVFAARMTRGFAGCLVRPRAIGPRGALIEVSLRDRDGARRRYLSEQPGGALVGVDGAARPPLETVLDERGHGRVQTTTRTSIERDGATVWRAPAGVLISDLISDAGAVVFTAIGPGGSELLRWAGGDPVVLARSAGGPASDGRDLVWFADDGGGPALFASPLGAALQPRRLRAAHQDYVDAGRGVVGDGLAMHVERRRSEPAGTLIVTRLADGRSWIVPPRAGTRWGVPLWIDRDELAIVLDPDAATVRAGTIRHGEAVTIVRLALPGAEAAS